MENPNHSARIRRCNSRPSRLQRRSTALMSRRLAAWNKNPYVGSFRHAPPSTVASIKACLERSSYATQHFYFSSSPQGNMRHSPYIGWFRHAPPSNVVTMHKVDPRDLAMTEKTRAWAMILSNIPIRDHRPKLSQVINGRLRGGGRDSRFLRNVVSEEESTAAGSLRLLSKLGTWILYPLAQDAESLYKACYYDRKLKVLTEDTREVEEGDSDCDSEDEHEACEESDEESLALSDIDGPVFEVQSSSPPSGSVAKPMELSVSEVAEAYYAHQELDDSPFAFMEGDRLDYVITQADIARMARNAARHLDVESILSLPTMTYRCPNKTVRNVRDSRDPDEAFSFIMVSEKFGRSMDQPEIESAIDSQCVICLEAFSEGDRLRVLPCNHSFHIGCIDRWLSGSHSHFECFTSGCPTCKKSPSTNHVVSNVAFTPGRQSPFDNDGSVPSWAFAQLGSYMAQSMGE